MSNSYVCSRCGQPLYGIYTTINGQYFHPKCAYTLYYGGVAWGPRSDGPYLSHVAADPYLIALEQRIAELERRVAELEAR